MKTPSDIKKDFVQSAKEIASSIKNKADLENPKIAMALAATLVVASALMLLSSPDTAVAATETLREGLSLTLTHGVTLTEHGILDTGIHSCHPCANAIGHTDIGGGIFNFGNFNETELFNGTTIEEYLRTAERTVFAPTFNPSLTLA
ncbi:MAG: hypothetical protein FWF23_05115 [Alphaproteobacteria bacterium]|nr:hypothetical protein [Alphaproteobacteria bacterium]MCL2505205.1 hypothetical protein [Alphaproteobacteria bacterium]